MRLRTSVGHSDESRATGPQTPTPRVLPICARDGDETHSVRLDALCKLRRLNQGGTGLRLRAMFASASPVCAFHLGGAPGIRKCHQRRHNGEVLFLALHRVRSSSAIFTAANSQRTRCPLWGREFAPPPSVVAAIQNQSAIRILKSSPSVPIASTCSSSIPSSPPRRTTRRGSVLQEG